MTFAVEGRWALCYGMTGPDRDARSKTGDDASPAGAAMPPSDYRSNGREPAMPEPYAARRSTDSPRSHNSEHLAARGLSTIPCDVETSGIGAARRGLGRDPARALRGDRNHRGQADRLLVRTLGERCGGLRLAARRAGRDSGRCRVGRVAQRGCPPRGPPPPRRGAPRRSRRLPAGPPPDLRRVDPRRHRLGPHPGIDPCAACRRPAVPLLRPETSPRGGLARRALPRLFRLPEAPPRAPPLPVLTVHDSPPLRSAAWGPTPRSEARSARGCSYQIVCMVT